MILFNCKVDIVRFTKVQDSMGGWSEAEGMLYQSLPCRINWSRGAEKIQFDKNTYYRDGKLYCHSIDVTVKDRVKYNGITYDIVDVNNVDEMNRYLILDIKIET